MVGPELRSAGEIDIQLADRPDLDAAMFRRRNAAGDLKRLVEVLCIDQVEAGQLLLGLGERTVIELHLAVADPHRCRGVHRVQRLRGEQPLAVGSIAPHSPHTVIRTGAPVLLIEVDEAKIFHDSHLSCCVPRTSAGQISHLAIDGPGVPNLSVTMPALFAQNAG